MAAEPSSPIEARLLQLHASRFSQQVARPCIPSKYMHTHMYITHIYVYTQQTTQNNTDRSTQHSLRLKHHQCPLQLIRMKVHQWKIYPYVYNMDPSNSWSHTLSLSSTWMLDHRSLQLPTCGVQIPLWLLVQTTHFTDKHVHTFTCRHISLTVAGHKHPQMGLSGHAQTTRCP